jgi:two-component system, NarL family, response regulator DesR
MSGIRTILADDTAGVRDTIAQLLALEPDIEVLGRYGDGPTALAAVCELRPDVAVLAHDLPGLDDIALADIGSHVLILASVTASGGFHTAMRAGVLGWIDRTAPCHRLVAAVRAVAAGQRYIDLDIADDPGWPLGSVPLTGTPLTARERRILSAASVCRSTREICETVGLSAETVGMVMCTLLAKTGGRDRVDAARIASTRGWI